MALRWKNFVPNTPLKAAEVNDLANNGCVQIDTATDLDDPNLVDANLAFDLATSTLYHRAAAGVGADKWTLAGVLPGLRGWAEISDAPTSTYTDTDGVKWNVWTYTAAGTLHVTKEGLLDVVLIGDGRGGAGYTGSRCSGGFLDGTRQFAVGAQAVTVATAGGQGNPAALGPYRTAAAGEGRNGTWASAIDDPTGYTSTIRGTSETFGEWGSTQPGAGGASPGAGGVTGIVIVRRPA